MVTGKGGKRREFHMTAELGQILSEWLAIRPFVHQSEQHNCEIRFFYAAFPKHPFKLSLTCNLTAGFVCFIVIALFYNLTSLLRSLPKIGSLQSVDD